MEQDTAAEVATVAAADATATIVVTEKEQPGPGPSTSKEEGSVAAATEATVATEKGEKEVNRKGVCVCGVDKSCAGCLRGTQTVTFLRRQVPASLAGMGAVGARSWGGGGAV